MRLILISLLAAAVTCSFPLAAAPVAFEQAVAAHQRGEHSAARQAFTRMAEAGFTEAQFNLGAMLLNGEGGPASRVDGALWVRLAADQGYAPASDALPTVLDVLDDTQSARMEERWPQWRLDYAFEALAESFAPEPCQTNCRSDVPDWQQLDGNRFLLFGKSAELKRTNPTYPREAVERGIMGIVMLGAWINAEGELEMAHVIHSEPEDVFDDSALKAMTQWSLEWLETPPDNLPRYFTQYIAFTLDRGHERNMPNGGQTRRELHAALENAEHDLEAAHRAIWLTDKLHMDVDQIDDEAMIDILERAALANIPSAQIDLSERQRSGDGVVQNHPAATFWLKHAAFNGSALAQYLLSTREAQINAGFAKDLRRAAARQGLPAAVLAEIRQQVEAEETADPEYLAELLEQLPRAWRRNSHPAIAEARRLADR